MEEENTFKILIATDNHIGYLERDPIRGNDSFKTFEEILQIAEAQQVDFILLGGDLFHHNRPSRSCLHKAMKLLRNYCFGEKESKIRIVSDPSVNFADPANYLDANLNISIPVFSIHGNHDDPSGSGNLCALNLLSVAGMVNYFGQSTSIEDVTIQPILMQKGDSKLAIYGLGNIREERLHRQWRSNKVKFLRAEEEEWRRCFNLFVFHQNRARHGPTSHIPEEFLDGFLDLVFWGHEHECRIHPEEYERFAITQPGSSIATSLSSGEAEAKHVGILKIEGDRFNLEKIRLKTIRPFQFTSVQLSRVEGLSPTNIKEIQTYLEGVVEDLIERAKMEWSEQISNSEYNVPIIEMPVPLIRIRVDYSGGYETFNPQQFGQKFNNRVANPKDILKFQRSAQLQPRGLRPSELLNDLTTAIPERLDTLKVEDLVSEMLSRDLAILPESGFEEAVMSLVEKSDKEAIRTFYTKSVTQIGGNTEMTPEDLSIEFVKRKAMEKKELMNTIYDTQHSHPTPISNTQQSSSNNSNMPINDVVSPTLEMQGNTIDDNNNNTSLEEQQTRPKRTTLSNNPAEPVSKRRRALPALGGGSRRERR
ncbi:hypothetical protein G6F46_003814 [Rhizopus delemar]|uniref:Double-strand break repair protein n=2 Tax=Rhizopus TaxID=4842 RepID=A0A9P6Z915_9FUNG|nr:hypothetical protein G6F55_002798 [Rhizopus delemar]KAG1547895.1 hypothetical protein G6F51_003993 [Rhizopus arrhizus]KAG1502260.1 hypothetical protein G6F54_002479 [Rhizopus delemar]KAG1517180.1 hypothetical protein G6F53_001578 [Rhizopus delemar]KAG1528280.1 hypothetical protein G6F52_000783 [Rhizopus delemar]